MSSQKAFASPQLAPHPIIHVGKVDVSIHSTQGKILSWTGQHVILTR